MAVRPIDAVKVVNDINLHHKPIPVSEFESGFNYGLNQAMWEIAHAPTLTQPNEPLTLEELRMIVEPTPVWWDWIQGWVLARRGMITTWNGRYHNAGSLRGDFYLHPPEGEEET